MEKLWNDSFYLPEDEIPKWLKRLGCFDKSKNSWRFRFSQNNYQNEISWKWGLGLQIYKSGDGPYYYGINFHLGYPGFYICLPFKSNKKSDGVWDSWGFNLFGPSIHFNWGSKTKIFYFLFIREYGYSETLMKDLTWYKEKAKINLGNKNWVDEYQYIKDNKHKELYDYHYMLKSGEVQKAKAEISINKMVDFKKGLKWLGWPKKIRYYIDISFKEFDDSTKIEELGERSGSWKGGVTGCSWDMRKGETAKQTLRRMQKERKFD